MNGMLCPYECHSNKFKKSILVLYELYCIDLCTCVSSSIYTPRLLLIVAREALNLPTLVFCSNLQNDYIANLNDITLQDISKGFPMVFL